MNKNSLELQILFRVLPRILKNARRNYKLLSMTEIKEL